MTISEELTEAWLAALYHTAEAAISIFSASLKPENRENEKEKSDIRRSYYGTHENERNSGWKLKWKEEEKRQLKK